MEKWCMELRFWACRWNMVFMQCTWSFSCVRVFCIIAHQASLSMGFSRQEYWSRLPFPPPGDLPHPGIRLSSPMSPVLQADSLPAGLPGKPKHWAWEDLLEEKMTLTLVFFPGKSHGQKSLVDYGPVSLKELDTTEWLSTTQNEM